MNIFKRLAQKLVNYFGYEIRRIGAGSSRRTMAGMLANVAQLGFLPSVVIDVGVAKGTFALYETFPNAHHLLLEPLEEFEEDIRSILKKYKGSYVFAAASSETGNIEINVHTNHLEGSSFYKETMGSEYNGVPRTVESVRIDDLIKERQIKGPYLIKIDVQGAEFDVLGGAIETLNVTELVILEVSMFQFMINSPQFYDVVVYMKNLGFVVYDIFGEHYRPLDGALGQIDMAFVKEDGIFRTDHAYATSEQWDKFMTKMNYDKPLRRKKSRHLL